MERSNGNGDGRRRVSSLRELPREITPARDLWPGIEARLRAAATGGGSGGAPPLPGAPRRPLWSRALALAAMVATLAVGIWIGRELLPAPGAEAPPVAAAANGEPPRFLQAAYARDPQLMQRRAELVSSLEAQLAALPPESRAKVAASLATIRKSMRDIEAALGRDPSNVLLQELLVGTYQDEMRVLVDVHEAGAAGQGI